MTVIEMLIFCIAVDFNRYYKQSRDEENNFLKTKIIKLIFHISRPKLTLIGVGGVFSGKMLELRSFPLHPLIMVMGEDIFF